MKFSFVFVITKTKKEYISVTRQHDKSPPKRNIDGINKCIRKVMLFSEQYNSIHFHAQKLGNIVTSKVNDLKSQNLKSQNLKF